MLPRPVFSGTTYLITRRCVERRFLLRPSPQTNRIIEYCLAVAAARTGVEVHAFCAMSNHVHAVATDTQGRLPEFLQFFHRHVAVAVNASLGRKENLWSGHQTSVVEIGDDQDVIDKLAYVVANPTAAGLVRAPQKWPGVITTRLGESKRIKRPADYFRVTGTMPEFASLHYTLPPQLLHLDYADANRRFFQALSIKVQAARADALAAGREFLGPKQVLKTSLGTAPSTSERTKTRMPRFAIRNQERRRAAVARWKAFQLVYMEALHRWRHGERSTRFPEGTWLMKRVHCAACGPPH
jgi:REP element-mobilizing transposase RayT